jgi:hypothetical protein
VVDQARLTHDFRTYATKIVSQPAVSRKVLTRSLDAVRADFSAGRAAVEAVGPPNVTAGTSIQAQVLEALSKGETLYAGVTARIATTEANGRALAATLPGISADVSAGGHALDDAFNGLDAQDTSGRLTTALRAEQSCATVTR